MSKWTKIKALLVAVALLLHVGAILEPGMYKLSHTQKSGQIFEFSAW